MFRIVLYFQLFIVGFGFEPSLVQVSPEDELCNFISSQCYFLRSRQGRPVENASEPVNIIVSLDLKRFYAIDDIDQTFSFTGAIRLVWYLPTCARWSEELLQNTNLSINAKKTMRCYFPISNIWVPNALVSNSATTTDLIYKYAFQLCISFT